MTEENTPNEKELWKRIPETQGVDRAQTFVALSHIAFDRGDHKASLALCESAREIYETLATTNTDDLLHVYQGITGSLKHLDREGEAAEFALHAVDVLKEDHPAEAVSMLRQAGRHYFSAGQYERSLTCHQSALTELDPDISEINIGVDYYNIGYAHYMLDHFAEAVPNLIKARELFKQGKAPERVFYCDEYLAAAYIELENGVDALLHAQRAVDYAVTMQNEVLDCWARYRLGSAKFMIGDSEDAEKELRKSRRMNTQACHVDWELAVNVEKELATVLKAKGEEDEANEILRRIKVIEETMDDA